MELLWTTTLFCYFFVGRLKPRWIDSDAELGIGSEHTKSKSFLTFRGAEPPWTHEMRNIQCLELVYSPLAVAESIPLSSRHVVAAHTPTTSFFSAARQEQPWGKWARIKGELQVLINAAFFFFLTYVITLHVDGERPLSALHTPKIFSGTPWCSRWGHQGWGRSTLGMAEIRDGVWIIML